MAKAGQAQDQAMDEILASIRRIIQDEDVRKSGVRASMRGIPDDGEGDAAPDPGNVSVLFSDDSTAGPAAEEVVSQVKPVPATQDDNVVELAIAQAMEAARAEVSGAASEPVMSPASDSGARRPAATSTSAARSPAAPSPPASRPQPLLSPRADAAVANSFQQLAGNMLAGGARPVDEVVEELLRPMLRNWLDANLPPLVERLVREEIERVSRGRR